MKKSDASVRSILLATAIFLLGSGCAKEDVPPAALPAVTKPVVVLPPPVSAEALTLLEFKLEKNQTGKPVLKGSIGNASPQKITYATATFTLFDKKGVEIGTSIAAVDNLGPESSWNFQVVVMQEDVASAKFAGFTAK